MTPLPPPLRAVTPRELAERVAAERRGAPYLLLLDGEGRQRIVELVDGQEPLSIGRQPDCDVPLPWDTEISRLHAVLEPIGDDWTLLDEGLSRNGSFVNGRRLHGRRRLSDGDAIRVGGSVLVFRAGSQSDLGTTETTPGPGAPELSPAQLRVLIALCDPDEDGVPRGPRSNREIGQALHLGVETVKSHLTAMFELFELSGLPQNRKRVELARRALDAGLLNARR